MARVRTMDGVQEVSVGDFMGFKSGIEQTGRVTAIAGNTVALSVYDSVTGDRDECRMDASRCWVE